MCETLTEIIWSKREIGCCGSQMLENLSLLNLVFRSWAKTDKQ